MKLTIDELKYVIGCVVREAKKKAKKDDDWKVTGIDGYDQDDVQPRGFSMVDSLDFSETSEEGNMYKKQGAANFGPFTSESAIRALARDIVLKEFNVKPVSKSKAKSSAPYGSRVMPGNEGTVGSVKMPEWNTTKKGSSVWEDLDRWYDVSGKSKASLKKFESNIMKSVFKERRERRAVDKDLRGFKSLNESLFGKKKSR